MSLSCAHYIIFLETGWFSSIRKRSIRAGRCRVPIINNREIRAAALGTSLEVIWPLTGYDHSDDDNDDGGGGYNDQHGV